MNVLVLAPVMTKDLCDDYFLYKRLYEKGVKLAFITGQSSGARANHIRLPFYENVDGIPIYRLYGSFNEMLLFPERRLKKILEIAKDLKPDLILCHLADNMNMALHVQKHLKIPIVLHVEIASDIARTKFRPRAIVKRLIGIPATGPQHWSWLCKKASAIITSHPPDKKILHLLSENGKPTYYLPWPASIPEDCELQSIRNRNRGIYAGLLIPFKNTEQFEWILPLILEKTPTKEFLLIGAGVHAAIIKKLEEKYHGAIKYIPRLKTRREVINFIANSYYAFTPVKRGGWGFIGDCWGTGTPLLMLNNIFVSEELDACVVKNREELIGKINRLYEDPEFYRQLQDIGYHEFNKRGVDVVSDELLNILSKTLKQKGSKAHGKP